MPYTATRTHIPDVIILEPKVFGDSRTSCTPRWGHWGSGLYRTP